MSKQAIDAALRMAQEKPHEGAIVSHVAGRTDHIPLDVPGESFVIPADVVSSLGEGNTLAGMKVLERMFAKPQGVPQRAKGGAVPIVAAGGEYVVPPEVVTSLGGGDTKRGMQIMRHFVLNARKEAIKTLSQLPGPVR